MDTPTADSLLDEADFLAELENLEVGLSALRGSPQPNAQHPYEALSALPAPIRPYEREPERTLEPLEPAEERNEPPTLLWQVAAAVMFVLMMGVGAAGAAVVFHERVTHILATW